MTFEQIVKENIQDTEKVNLIINYYLEELKLDEKEAINHFNKVLKYSDIFNEFINSIVEKTYEFDNAVSVENYTAKQISNLNAEFTNADVYHFLIMLRIDPERTKQMLDLHQTIKEVN